MALLILCCFGGIPFVDFQQSGGGRPSPVARHQWDPTDWVATDLAGKLSLDSLARGHGLLPEGMTPEEALEQCDLWNLTFASGAEEHLFRRGRARLACRCSPGFHGLSCQHKSSSASAMTLLASSSISPTPTLATSGERPQMPLALSAGISRSENSFTLYLVLFMLFALAMVAMFVMLRGCCFCDCFGGFSRAGRNYEQPLDPRTVDRCLDAVRAHEQKEKDKWSTSSMVVDSRRPLLPPTVPSVSHSVQMEQPLPTAVPPPRTCSPPPSYRSRNSSQNSKI